VTELNVPETNVQEPAVVENIVGLRVDVDTFRGTRDGVPGLLAVLRKHATHATFFFSVGPDNMGRHLWRLLKPAFLLKMLRSNAASLYGWDILLRGTLWPGPIIGRKLGRMIRDTAAAGHEVGLHAWDHHRWQTHMEAMDAETIREDIRKGVEQLTEILGVAPRCSAVAGWKANSRVLLQKHRFPFVYNSDCRGSGLFRPLIDGIECAPQIPVTLPTYDELIGSEGIDNDSYNAHLLQLIQTNSEQGRLNVLTIHAEVEGIVCAGLFDAFLTAAHQKGIHFVPLQQLLPDDIAKLPTGGVIEAPLPGREGRVCQQAGAA
jgi:undecaprenyl phosphate-alpha-L-ara4FN deformylase